MKRKIISYTTKEQQRREEQRAHLCPTDGPAVIWIKQMMSHSGGCYYEQAVIHHHGLLRLLRIEWDLSSCYTSTMMPLCCSKKIKVGWGGENQQCSSTSSFQFLTHFSLFFCFILFQIVGGSQVRVDEREDAMTARLLRAEREKSKVKKHGCLPLVSGFTEILYKNTKCTLTTSPCCIIVQNMFGDVYERKHKVAHTYAA